MECAYFLSVRNTQETATSALRNPNSIKKRRNKASYQMNKMYFIFMRCLGHEDLSQTDQEQ